MSSAFNATLNISQVVYELKAVGEQTRDLLDTTKHINDSMGNVKIVRRQKSKFLDMTEKEWIDREIENAVKAVEAVAALIEPARVDMSIKSERKKDISFMTRATFVLRDSPKVATNLIKLSVATQGLNTAMGILCNREGSAGMGRLNETTTNASERRTSSPNARSLPSYELSEFLNRRRTTPGVKRHKSGRNRVSFVASDGSENDLNGLMISRSGRSIHRSDNIQNSPSTEESVISGDSQGITLTEAPYLDRFVTTPACIPILALEHTGNMDSWRQEALKALHEPVDVDTETTDHRVDRDLGSNQQNPNSMSDLSFDPQLATVSMTGDENVTYSRTISTEVGPASTSLHPLNSYSSQAKFQGMSEISSPILPRITQQVKRKPISQTRPGSSSSSSQGSTTQSKPHTQPDHSNYKMKYPYLRQTPVSPSHNLDQYFNNPYQNTSPPQGSQPQNQMGTEPAVSQLVFPPLTPLHPFPSFYRAEFDTRSDRDHASQAPEIVPPELAASAYASSNSRAQPNLSAPFSLCPNLAEAENTNATEIETRNQDRDSGRLSPEERRTVSTSLSQSPSSLAERSSEGKVSGERDRPHRRSRGREWLERRAGIDVAFGEIDEV